MSSNKQSRITDLMGVLAAGILVVFGVLIGGTATALAGMQQVVLEQNPADHSPREQWTTADKARNVAFVKAVVQEAEAIVPGRMDPAQRAAVRKELAGAARSLVLSYAGERYTRSPGRIRYQAEVAVNTPQLKARLKKWGTFYTAGNAVGFRLETQGLTEEQRREVSHWQAVSGVAPRSVDAPALQIVARDGLWRLELRTQGQRWSHSAPGVATAWQEVWSRYFAQSAIQARVVDRMRLEVSGWPTVEGVSGWSTLLGEWDASVDEAELVTMRLDEAGVQAWWVLRVLDAARLKQQVSRAASRQKLDFALEGLDAQGSFQAP